MVEENVEKDMTPVLLEDLGFKYPKETSKLKRHYGLYQCQYCGKEWEVMHYSIESGNSKSCGCLSIHITHGLRQHILYGTWNKMKHRCYNKNAKSYKNYGGRGIQVCERWWDIKNFIEDMYPSYQEGLTLDRIDVDGNYEPDNCRWTTRDIQGQNTRDIMSTNKSGFRGVCWHKRDMLWRSQIGVNNKKIQLGSFPTALEAAKAYERYVRLNNLKHNFTPALTEEEIEELNLSKF